MFGFHNNGVPLAVCMTDRYQLQVSRQQKYLFAQPVKKFCLFKRAPASGIRLKLHESTQFHKTVPLQQIFILLPHSTCNTYLQVLVFILDFPTDIFYIFFFLYQHKFDGFITLTLCEEEEFPHFSEDTFLYSFLLFLSQMGIQLCVA